MGKLSQEGGRKKRGGDTVARMFRYLVKLGVWNRRDNVGMIGQIMMLGK